MKRFIAVFSLVFSLCLISCPNNAGTESYEQETPYTPLDASKVRLSLNLDIDTAGTRLARDTGTLIPSNKLVNIELKGKLGNEEVKTLASGQDKESLNPKIIEIDTGNWTFYMTGYVGDVLFRQVQTINIQSGMNSLTFTLKPVDADGHEIVTGTLNISLKFTGEANYAKLTLTKMSDSSEVIKEYDNISQEEAISYKRNFFDGTGLDPDTYDIKIDFYYKDYEHTDLQPIELNSWEAYSRIGAGLVSSVVVNEFDLNEVYRITYNNKFDDSTLDISVTDTVILMFSRKTGTITLPKYPKDGYYFLGWYREENGSASAQPVTQLVSKNNLSNQTFYALWASNRVYVKNGGEEYGYSEESPAPNIETALSTVSAVQNRIGSEKIGFNIIVDGEITGKTIISSDFNAPLSISIEGKTGNETDILNGNNNDRVLEITSLVPVTLKNIKITGGKSTSSGGGVLVKGTNSTSKPSLTIESGTIITANSINASNANGIGLYAEYAEVTMNGGEIYNNNETSKENIHGGVGLNHAKFTLNDGKVTNNSVKHKGANFHINAESELYINDGEISNGLVTRSGDGNAAGIWVDGGSKIIMSGGKICGNRIELTGDNSLASGAAVFLSCNGSLKMSGGIIENNIATGSSCRGGAVFVSAGAVFELSGTAQIPYGVKNTNNVLEKGSGKNDVFLAKNDSEYAKIVVPADITEHSVSNPIGVTEEFWARGVPFCVVSEEQGAITTLPTSLKNKFELNVNASDGWEKFFADSARKLCINAPIYVGTKDDVSGSDNNFGTKTSPYATLDRACKDMKDATVDYVININGIVGSNSDDNQEILYDLTNDNTGTYRAKSVKIIGKNGNTVDKICGARYFDSSITGSGPALKISSKVPVIIENVTISGGAGSESMGHGGGIYLCSEGTLSLGDGVIIKDSVSDRGAGVYMSTDSNLFMYGSAIIGYDDDGSTYLAAKKYGGGIYSLGNVYLGYIGFDSNNNPIERELTGGVYKCKIEDSSKQGSAIYVNKFLQMKSGNIVQNGENVIDIQNSAKFIMLGGTISSGTHGVRNNSNGTFEMSGGTIKQCSVAVENSGIFKFSGGTIGPNTIFSFDSSSKVAGVYNSNSGEFYMTGGSISNNINKGKADGAAGVYNAGQFNMSNGTISNNSSADSSYKHGGAIYNTGTFNISSNAYIPDGVTVNDSTTYGEGKNDIYVAGGSIKITGNMSKHTATSKIALTPDTWSRGKIVLQNSSYLSDNISKFKIVDPEWSCILHENQGKIDAPIYVAGTNHADTVGDGNTEANGGRGTKAFPYASLEEAVNQCWNSSKDFTIYVSGNLTESQQKIPAANSTNKTGLASSITITGVIGSSTDGINRNLSSASSTGSALVINTTSPVTLTKLKIQKGYSDTNGGGINNASASLTIGSDVVITNNSATSNGGGIYSLKNVTMNDSTCEVSSNTAACGGGIYIGNSASVVLTMSAGKIYSNTANGTTDDDNGGGGVYVEGAKISMSGGSIYSNTASKNGAGVHLNDGYFYMTGSAIIGNTSTSLTSYPSSKTSASNKADGNGGGLYASVDSSVYLGKNSSGTAVELTGGIIYNSATKGGGIYMSGNEPFNFASGNVNYNYASSAGGGLHTKSGALMSGGTIKGNYAGSDGGVYMRMPVLSH